MWEGRSREAPPYPDLWRKADLRYCSSPLSAAKSGSRRAFSTAPTSKDPMTGSMTAAAENIRVLRGQVPMRQGKSPYNSVPETKSSPSTAARLRLFDCRTSTARTTGIAVEKNAPHTDHCSANAHMAPQSCASHNRPDPFLCAASSAYKRVITDVAISPFRGRRRKCAEARR